LCNRAQWEIRELVKRMVELVDPQLHFMLVPKCQSGSIICNSPCRGGNDE
jgi:thymidylate synthase ThyX